MLSLNAAIIGIVAQLGWFAVVVLLALMVYVGIAVLVALFHPVKGRRYEALQVLSVLIRRGGAGDGGQD
ncbi:hypothetical protein EV191_1221 [Tamaricihabitans halophyticus]|uniref:Uncharacterized protein n=1 Tax=Tamaricihabitans halophyticus TaxID=1262583 RepID=A0A4R2Q6B8_9PSEU|nr:hypothetical protein EV191_1221 [Tamaricihabitans halophyticus]